jgi:DNA-binding NarL/FixJ family response regulator
MVEPLPVLGSGLREVLERESDIEVVAQVPSPEEAIPIVQGSAPDVVLVDAPIEPESSGAIATRRLRRRTPGAAVVVLGGADDDASIVAAVEIGAVGHVAGTARPQELVATVRRVAEGQDPIKEELRARPDLVARIVDDVRSRVLDEGDVANPLTKREMDVLRLVGAGLRNQEIAERLEVSLQTVKNHVSTVLHKLGARNRDRAVMYARRQGWLETGQEGTDE